MAIRIPGDGRRGIVFDAPTSFGKSLLSAIAKVTDRPVKMLVYSHVHKDHLGGSLAFKDVKDLKIVAGSTPSPTF